MTKIIIRILISIASVAGLVFLGQLSVDNRQLRSQIDRLEAELGRMPIDDVNRVYLAEIEKPNVPPEVAPHIEHLWQFRCYLPAGYDFVRHSSGGQVAEEGCYSVGSSSSSWGSPQSDPTHRLLTVSFQRKEGRLDVFHAFGGASGTSSWGRFYPRQMDESLIVQKLVSSKGGPRSFDQSTILPLLKIFDPSTAKESQVDGRTITTYAGGLFVLCPKSRESEFKQLAAGETPANFDPNSIAKVNRDE